MAFDYVIVGSGMFGGVLARALAEGGRRSLVVDQRPHIGGNCFPEEVAGIHGTSHGGPFFGVDGGTGCPALAVVQ